MALTFEQKLVLEDGSMVFYHEASLSTGEIFHFITLVPGARLEDYFNFIATKENFPVNELEAFAKILRCEKGQMTDAEVGLFLEASDF